MRLLYFAAAVVVLKVRPRARPVVAQEDELEYAETHLPVVVVSSIGMIAIRAAVGFFIFTIAFTLRRDSEPAYVYGVAAACYAVGAFIGHSAASMLRGRLREEQLIAVAIAAPAAFTAVGMLGVSVPLLMLIAALVGFSTTLGRNAFDALVQRVAPGRTPRSGRRPLRDRVPAGLGVRRGAGHPDLPAGRGEHDGAHADLRAGVAVVPACQS